MWVTGPSMYPFLNTDYNSTTRKDVVLVDMRSPWVDLKRGMIIALWWVAHSMATTYFRTAIKSQSSY